MWFANIGGRQVPLGVADPADLTGAEEVYQRLLADPPRKQPMERVPANPPAESNDGEFDKLIEAIVERIQSAAELDGDALAEQVARKMQSVEMNVELMTVLADVVAGRLRASEPAAPSTPPPIVEPFRPLWTPLERAGGSSRRITRQPAWCCWTRPGRVWRN